MVRSVARDHCSSPAGSSPSGRRKEEATLWQNRLLSYSMERGWRAACRPQSHPCGVGNGSALMRGGAFVEAIKLRGNFLPTQVSSVRGRHRTANQQHLQVQKEHQDTEKK